jgi:hypothetical protein
LIFHLGDQPSASGSTLENRLVLISPRGFAVYKGLINHLNKSFGHK